MVMSPLGLGTKNHCAGKGQQQFSSQSVKKNIKANYTVEKIAMSVSIFVVPNEQGSILKIM
jgi:hypothetical protein